MKEPSFQPGSILHHYHEAITVASHHNDAGNCSEGGVESHTVLHSPSTGQLWAANSKISESI
jgi:hypothetical protein